MIQSVFHVLSISIIPWYQYHTIVSVPYHSISITPQYQYHTIVSVPYHSISITPQNQYHTIVSVLYHSISIIPQYQCYLQGLRCLRPRCSSDIAPYVGYMLYYFYCVNAPIISYVHALIVLCRLFRLTYKASLNSRKPKYCPRKGDGKPIASSAQGTLAHDAKMNFDEFLTS